MNYRDQRDRGVSVGVNPTIWSETLQVVGLVEASGREFRLRKKTMNLCALVLASSAYARRFCFYASVFVFICS